MSNIKTISDLINYRSIFEEESIYLKKWTRKNDKIVAELKIMKMLNEGLASGNEEGWTDEDSMRLHFEERFEKE